jgi:hypothetical protein
MTDMPRNRPMHTRSRLAFYALGCLIAQSFFIVILAVRHYALSEQHSPALGIDFAVYWAAARVAMEHGAAAIYSAQFMAPVELAVRPYTGYTPWPYPPTFLLFVVPFGLLPFGLALSLFLAVTLALYAWSIHSIARPLGIRSWLYALAFPAVSVVVAFGQNSFLTVAIAGAGLYFLPKRPVLAGAFIAMLTIKPQLAVLFPFFLICGRQWRAFTSTAAFALLLVTVSVLAFGTDAIAAFIHALAAFHHDWLENDAGEIWYALTSVYGVARVWNANSAVGYGIHAAVAVPAIAAVAWLWWNNARYELRAAALALGAMLAPPYIVFYDLAWLALPLAFLAVDFKKHRASRAELAVLVAAWFLPAQALFARWFPSIGQWSPAVLVALLALIVLRHLREQKASFARDRFRSSSVANQNYAEPRIDVFSTRKQ